MSQKKLFYISFLVILFLVSFITRVTIINKSPEGNQHMDLELYQAGAALIIHGVNPYNYQDKVEIRNILRLQSHTLAIRDDQNSWNYWSSGNLPLNQLFYALISIIKHDPYFYRLVFAFFDSILAIIVFVFITKHWYVKSYNSFIRLLKYICGILLGTLSPILLIWGTKISEDKGIESLLILSAIVCLFSQRKFMRWYLSSVLLGLSIAFKGLGVLLFPLYITKIYSQISQQQTKFALSIFLLIFFTVIWFVPFIPDVVNLMLYRLQYESVKTPEFASMWTFVYQNFPQHWSIFKFATIIIISVIAFLGLFYKKLSTLNFCGTLLLTFVAIYMIGGSLDRIHMAILLSTLFMGTQNIYLGFILSFFYLVLGIASIIVNYGPEIQLSPFILLFVSVYILCLLILLIRRLGKLNYDNSK